MSSAMTRSRLYLALLAITLGSCRGGTTPAPDDMVAIPAGAFTMGCVRALDPTCSDIEEPAREIHVPAFRIDRTEVTRAAYRRCTAAGACTPPASPCGGTPWDTPSLARHPITCVDWDQARAFCAWRGGRLPTEAEWEKAARGTDRRVYPWGNSEPGCDTAVHAACGEAPREVGSRPAGASPYGALDMAGNVSEWVSDPYVAYDDPGGRKTLDGARSGAGRVARDDNHDAWHMRATNRNYLAPGHREPNLGLRCAQSL
jgi:formylglycine-generating enzyme required for sulfatase activity